MSGPVRAVRVPTTADLEAAWKVISGHLPPTPLNTAYTGGPPIALKLESLQPTGSFKVRGALNALATVPRDVPVVTASSGNHGLGMAFAAGLTGRPVTVVVSRNASPAKVSALRAAGIDLVRFGDSFDDAEAYALMLAEDGAYYVSTYNDPYVIAGQATIGYELDGELAGDVTVLCGVGGGGLAAGLGLWRSTRPNARVVAVEPEASTAMSAAVRAGHQVTVEVGETLADGIAGNIEPGSVTIDLVRRHVDDLVTVSETEIREAVRYLAATRGVIAEGSGAVGVAALLAGKVAARGTQVAVVTGRNIALPTLTEVLAG
ncbi:threonine ammonia-lyase [Amycolatopsis pithecellobii]|uniref:Pyridoxal-phosphate dependent enzyme n=1 Tax=Amycolatopsis pithecellobii TaxID=664692 RepID=A0A6N7YVC2_9PSEU|nr:pyridoxal-phosphate dependent enzyme [Amycolatopsis pithecellobii]MTD57015.1 pyridoxal-phosphate dependent enzyme [Amycolatopsis pithecellobii]